MSRILESLVSRKDIHEKFFEPIILDLLENVWNRQWRTREASCRGIADILVGKKVEQIEPHLEDLWEKLFRVADDSKDTVREAAASALKALGNVSLRICDPTKTRHDKASHSIEKILPYVCKKGIMSSVEEIQAFSVEFICDLVKSASFLLKPQVATLLEVLMTSLTELEGASMNYLQVHAEKMGMQEQAEAMRLNMTTNSPISDTIKMLLEQIDQSNIKEVISTLETLLSNSVGLQTRVGAAKFTMQLAAKHGEELLKPFVSKLLSKIKTSALKSKSPSVRSTYAQCMGFLCRHASDSAIKRLLDGLSEAYSKSESDDSASRGVVGHALLELARAASHRLQPLYKDVVPLIFLAKHDSDKETQKAFIDTWQEIGPSLSLYLPQIVELLTSSLSSASYVMKIKAANATETLSTSVNSSDLEPYFMNLVQVLAGNLKGMHWNGKEALVSAIGTFVNGNKDLLKAKPEISKPVQELVLTVITGECKKKNKTYKQQAFHTFSVLLETFQEIDENFDFLEKAWPLLTPILEEEKEEKTEGKEADAEKDAERVAKEKLRQSVKSSALSVLGFAWPYNTDTQQKFISDVLAVLTKTTSNVGNLWGLRVASINALTKVLSKINPSILTVSMVHLVVSSLSPNLLDGKVSVVRVASLKAVSSLLAKTEGTDLLSNVKPTLIANIEEVEKIFPGRHYEIQTLLELLRKR
eukprot:TRINITY_DN7488_c0_g1_i1.p1 TRINITY_DN7488_c0_g1~~TRINITY_DN7488_c0_g1_i1.p1  ORF type:complete len:744 (-),score=193.58 TRINITY_DN7488_c0_g1_i1:9-2108(-)